GVDALELAGYSAGSVVPASAPTARPSPGSASASHTASGLADLLISAANQRSRGCVVVGEAGQITQFGYDDLLRDARCVLGGLRTFGVRPGDIVILLCRDDIEFLVSFWACLLGGIRPVPEACPTTYLNSATVPKVQNALRLFATPWVIAGSAESSIVRESLGSAARVADVALLRKGEPQPDVPTLAPTETALLFLMSGSVDRPRAVELSHRSLLRTVRAASQQLGITGADVSLNWLGLAHSGGLVMSHLRDVLLGCEQIQVATKPILADPLSWLDYMQTHRVSISWAPHFAFALVNRALARSPNRSWDLSALRILINAGEMIDAEQARQFVQNVRRFGAVSDVLRPTWGMTETCSGVTYGSFDADQPVEQGACVCVGAPLAVASLRVVDAGNRVLPDGQVGRVQIKGDCVTTGYYGNPAADAEAFVAGGWFRTGDLGFLRDTQFTITGREKDIIIINGLNFNCREIEALVETIDGVIPSFTAALPVRGTATEDVALIFHSVASGADAQQLIRRIRMALIRAFGVNPRQILQLDAHRIPKNDQGEVLRGVLARELFQGSFRAALEAAPSALAAAAPIELEAAAAGNAPPVQPDDQAMTPTERTLAEIWSRVLKVEKVGRRAQFFELGGTSLTAAELLLQIERAFARRFSFASIVSLPTVEAFAAEIDRPVGTGKGHSRYLVPLQTNGSAPPFFGMHPLFGLVYVYAELARLLGPQQPVYALQAKGFAPGELPNASIEQMAAEYI
ncbi:MAG TPA: AMP-binding protein, partial [Polyangiaceae bacterium]